MPQNSADIYKKNSIRIESLDWLRGLCALSILIFHFFSFYSAAPSASYLLGRLGIYGVSIFFILSGLSMAIVYNQYLTSISNSIRFCIRRIFRIYPLMWIAIIGALIYGYMIDYPTGAKKIFLNFTGLFGFVSPGMYIATGSWFLGNELVYYSLTPLIIFFFNKNLIYGNIFCCFTWIIGLFFAFHLLPVLGDSVDKWWITYINPFNNLFLYTTGIALYYNFKNLQTGNFSYLILFASIAGLSFFPTESKDIDIITNYNRILFCIFSVALTFSFWKIPIRLPGVFRIPLDKLGIATYGIYLTHPLIFQTLRLVFKDTYTNIPFIAQLVIGSTITIALSLIVYHYIESPLIRIGKVVTQRKTQENLVRNLNRP